MSKFPSSPTEYEKIVQEIFKNLLKSQDIDTEVRHNVRDIKGKSETFPQIDVYYRFKVAGIEHRVVISCKNYTRKVSVEDVRDLHFVVQDIAATKGVIVTTVGYQTGAEQVAKSVGIDLKLVTSPNEVKNWGDYLKKITINMSFIVFQLCDLKIDCDDFAHKDPANLKRIVDNGELLTTIPLDGQKIYDAHGNELANSLKELACACISTDEYKFDSQIYSRCFCPMNVFLMIKKVNNERVLLRVIKLEVFYKTMQSNQSLTVDHTHNARAVLQDHKTNQIEYIL